MNNGGNGLDVTSQKIIDYISKNLNDDGLCTRSKGAISNAIGVSQKTVQRKIQDMAESGKVLIVKIGTNSNGYKISQDNGDSHSLCESVAPLKDEPQTVPLTININKEDYEKTVSSVSDALLRRGLAGDEKFIREHLPFKEWDRKRFESFKKKLIDRLTTALKSSVKDEDAVLFICWNWAVLKRLFSDEWVEGMDIRKILNPSASGENRCTGRLVRLLIFCEPVGDSNCPICNGSGYSGRSAVAEVMVVDDDIRPYLIREDINGLRKHLQAAGFRSLKDDALEKVISWHTDIKEIRRIGIIFEEK